MKEMLKIHNSNNECCTEKPTNRHLNLQSEEFMKYLNGYEQWLRVLGYAEIEVYSTKY